MTVAERSMALALRGLNRIAGSEVVDRLVPQDQYATLARPRIVGTVTSAASDRFVAEILGGT